MSEFPIGKSVDQGRAYGELLKVSNPIDPHIKDDS